MNDARIDALLSKWERHFEENQVLTPEQLCADDPELLPVLRERIEQRLAASGSGFQNQKTTPQLSAPDHSTRDPNLTTDHINRASDEQMPDQIGHYQIEEEIARGGMGAVLRARDPNFDRALAIKITLRELQGNQDAERRFMEEAILTGRLQHPGIPPVHELGHLDDGRPYFAMKLIEGQTLATLLKKRSSPRSELPRFLSIFEQVCQTIGYAHSLNVIHRDLKPQNIMVGAFGEVQVMDWGLARRLATPSEPETVGSSEPTVASAHNPDSATVAYRSGEESSHTRAGDVLGTPAYLAPEQAQGRVDQVDKRSDVFGLGAILAQILTGQPLYQGSHIAEILEKAARGNWSEAEALLDQCQADPELIALTKQCLAFDRESRPRDAAEVAMAIERYQEQVEERLKRAELEKAQTEVRAAEERKRHEVEQAKVREQRRRRKWTLVAALAFIGVGIGVAASLFLNDAYQKEAASRAIAEKEKKEKEEQRQLAVRAAHNEKVQREKAEGATRLAEKAQQSEEEQRKKAEQAAANEKTARQKAEEAVVARDRTAYHHQVFLAETAFRNDNVLRAEELLQTCDPKLRGWEWHHLHALCHSELYSVQGASPLFTSDGNVLFIQSSPRALDAHNAWTGKKLAEFAIPGKVRKIAMSPRGKRLLLHETLTPGQRSTLLAVQTFSALSRPFGTFPEIALTPVQRKRLNAEPEHLRILDLQTKGIVHERLLAKWASPTLISWKDNAPVIKVRQNGEFQFLQLQTGAVLFRHKIQKGDSELFSDGHHVLITSRANAQPIIKVFKLSTGQMLSVIEGTEHLANPVLFSDHRRVAVSTPGRFIHIADLKTGKYLQTFRSPLPMPRLILSPDNAALVLIPWKTGDPLVVHDPKTGKLLRHLSLPPYRGTDPVFSPDGEWLVTSGTDGIVRRFHMKTGREDPALKSARRLYQPIYSPDGSRLMATDERGRWIVYDARDRLKPFRLMLTHQEAARFSPDSSKLFVQIYRKRDRLSLIGVPWDLWEVDLQRRRQRRILVGRMPAFYPVFSKDASLVAISIVPPQGRGAGRTEVYDLRTGRRVSIIHGSAFRQFTFSPDNRWIVTWGPGWESWVSDVRTGRQVMALGRLSRRNFEEGPQFSPDGALLAYISENAIGHVVHVEENKELCTLKESARLNQIAFSPNGNQLAVATIPADGKIRIHEARSGKELVVLPVKRMRSLLFSPDGNRIAADARNGIIRIFDVQSGKEQLAIKGAEYIWGRTFSPDGNRILLWGSDAVLRMHDAWTGQETPVPQIPGKSQPTGRSHPENLMMSPDGTWILVRHYNGTYLWEAPLDLQKHRVAKQSRAQRSLRKWHSDKASEFKENRNEHAQAFHLERLSHLPPVSLSTVFNQAILLNRMGRIEEAKSVFKKVLSGRGAIPLELKGFVLGELGQWEAASQAFERVIRTSKQPSHTLWMALALLQSHRGDTNGYAATCEELRKRFSRSRNGMKIVARAAAFAPRGLKTYIPVIEKLWTIVRLYPEDLEARKWLGAMLYRAGRAEDAILELERAQKLLQNAKDPISLFFLAMAHHRQGNRAQASHYQRLAEQVAQEKQYADWATRLEAQLLQKEVRDLSQQIAQELQQQMPLSERAKLLAREGKWKEVIAVLAPALAQQPWRHQLHVLQAYAFSRLGEQAKAFKHYWRAASLRPHSPLVPMDRKAWERGAFATFRGEWLKAEEAFRLVYAQSRGNLYRDWYPLLLVLLKQGKIQEYQKICTEIAQRAKGITNTADQLRAVLLCATGPLAKANAEQWVQMATEGVKKQKNASSLLRLGSALYRSGRYKDAIAVLLESNATHGKGGYSLTWCYLAMAHFRQGSGTEANKWLRKTEQWYRGNKENLVSVQARLQWEWWMSELKQLAEMARSKAKTN